MCTGTTSEAAGEKKNRSGLFGGILGGVFGLLLAIGIILCCLYRSRLSSDDAVAERAPPSRRQKASSKGAIAERALPSQRQKVETLPRT